MVQQVSVCHYEMMMNVPMKVTEITVTQMLHVVTLWEHSLALVMMAILVMVCLVLVAYTLFECRYDF